MTGNYPALLEEMLYDKHFLYLLRNISSVEVRASILNIRFCLAVIDFMSGSRLQKFCIWVWSFRLHLLLRVIHEAHMNRIQGG
jgi:hypothetical protein